MTPKADLEAERLRRQWSAANLFDAGDTREARDRIERLLAELEPGHGRADSSFLLSIMSWNDVRAVTRALERALAEAGDDKLLRAKTLADFGWARLQVRDLAGASAHARAALKLAEEIGDSFCLRLALSVLATAEHLLGQPSTGLLRRAMSLEGALVHAEASTATICFARQQTYAGDLDGARATLESELHRFEEQGRETATWEIQNDLAQIEYRAGRWNVAMDHAETAREISQDAGLDVLAEILPVMTATETARGRVDVARTLGEEGLGICERTGDRWHELFLRAGLGFLAISLDDAAEANSWMDPAIRSMQAMGLEEPGFCPLIPDEVEALVMLGELEQAKALTDWLAFRGRALDRPLARATASRCQGLITAALGDGSGALAYLDRAI